MTSEARSKRGDAPTFPLASFEPVHAQEHIALFLAYLKDDDLSPRTIKAYRYNLERFLGWLYTSMGDVPPTYQDAGAYRDHLVELGRRVSSINQCLAAVRRFLDWGRSMGLISTSGKVKEIRETRIPRPAMDGKSTRRLLTMMEREAPARDRAIVLCGLGLGLRISEICSLRIRDVGFTPRTITVRVLGKGRVSREVQSAGKRTRDWILERVREVEDSSEENVEGRPLIGLRASFASELVRSWGLRAGIDGLHPHMLRRTYGQIRRRAGISIEVVSRELGHSRLDTTAIYTTPEGQDWDVLEEGYL